MARLRLKRAEQRGKRIRLRIPVQMSAEDGEGYRQFGAPILLSCPSAAAVRYIRRRLDDLVAELDGLAIEPEPDAADHAAA